MAYKKKCPKCNGSGDHGCPRGSSGKVTCAACDGAGCGGCSGRGTHDCALCGGDGSVQCWWCNGSGKVAEGFDAEAADVRFRERIREIEVAEAATSS